MPFLRQKYKKQWVKNTRPDIFTRYKSLPIAVFVRKNQVLFGTTVALDKGVDETKKLGQAKCR